LLAALPLALLPPSPFDVVPPPHALTKMVQAATTTPATIFV
jgi:hypothetical protein